MMKFPDFFKLFVKGEAEKSAKIAQAANAMTLEKYFVQREDK